MCNSIKSHKKLCGSFFSRSGRKKEIRFFISKGNQYFNIRVINIHEGKIIFDKNSIPQTNKEEKADHGFGIRSVSQAVEKYDGKCSMDSTQRRVLFFPVFSGNYNQKLYPAIYFLSVYKKE